MVIKQTCKSLFINKFNTDLKCVYEKLSTFYIAMVIKSKFFYSLNRKTLIQVNALCFDWKTFCLENTIVNSGCFSFTTKFEKLYIDKAESLNSKNEGKKVIALKGKNKLVGFLLTSSVIGTCIYNVC